MPQRNRKRYERQYNSAGTLIQEIESEDAPLLLAERALSVVVCATAGAIVAPPDQRLLYACVGAFVPLLPDLLAGVGASGLPDIALRAIDAVPASIAAWRGTRAPEEAAAATPDLLPSRWHYVAGNAKRMLRHTFEQLAEGQSKPWAFQSCQDAIEHRPYWRNRQDAWTEARDLWVSAGIISDKNASTLSITRTDEGYGLIFKALTPYCYLSNGVWYDRWDAMP